MAIELGRITIGNEFMDLILEEDTNIIVGVSSNGTQTVLTKEQIKILDRKNIIDWKDDQQKQLTVLEEPIDYSKNLQNLSSGVSIKKKFNRNWLTRFGIFIFLIIIAINSFVFYGKLRDTPQKVDYVKEYIEPVKLSKDWINVSKNSQIDSFIQVCLTNGYGKTVANGMSGRKSVIRDFQKDASLQAVINIIAPEQNISYIEKSVLENSVYNGTKKISFIQFKANETNYALVKNVINKPNTTLIYYNPDLGAPLFNAMGNNTINNEIKSAITENIQQILYSIGEPYVEKNLTIYNNQEVEQRSAVYKSDKIFAYYEYNGTTLVQCRISILNIAQ